MYWLKVSDLADFQQNAHFRESGKEVVVKIENFNPEEHSGVYVCFARNKASLVWWATRVQEQKGKNVPNLCCVVRVKTFMDHLSCILIREKDRVGVCFIARHCWAKNYSTAA